MSTPHTRTTVRPAVAALGGALTFVASYLAVDLVAGRRVRRLLPSMRVVGRPTAGLLGVRRRHRVVAPPHPLTGVP